VPLRSRSPSSSRRSCCAPSPAVDAGASSLGPISNGRADPSTQSRASSYLPPSPGCRSRTPSRRRPSRTPSRRRRSRTPSRRHRSPTPSLSSCRHPRVVRHRSYRLLRSCLARHRSYRLPRSRLPRYRRSRLAWSRLARDRPSRLARTRLVRDRRCRPAPSRLARNRRSRLADPPAPPRLASSGPARPFPRGSRTPSPPRGMPVSNSILRRRPRRRR
jgi:serine/arginine repetitive matrix protein 1